MMFINFFQGLNVGKVKFKGLTDTQEMSARNEVPAISWPTSIANENFIEPIVDVTEVTTTAIIEHQPLISLKYTGPFYYKNFERHSVLLDMKGQNSESNVNEGPVYQNTSFIKDKETQTNYDEIVVDPTYEADPIQESTSKFSSMKGFWRKKIKKNE